VLVPKKAMNEVNRLLAEADEKTLVEFARDDAHLFFKVGPRLLISRLLTGQFPTRSRAATREHAHGGARPRCGCFRRARADQ
jgi:DNA polymerase-3 subunit beta